MPFPTVQYGSVSPTPSSSPDTLIYDASEAETGFPHDSESNLAPSELVPDNVRDFTPC